MQKSESKGEDTLNLNPDVCMSWALTIEYILLSFLTYINEKFKSIVCY